MAEYIEREAIIQKAFSSGLCDAYGNMYGSGDVVFIDDILGIPAADVAPVVHGRWIDRTGPDDDLNVTDTCSVCLHTDTHSPIVLAVIELNHNAMDKVKIGKLNYHPSDIDWANFGREAEALCKELGIDYYIKDSLRAEMEKSK